jgi:O-antigen ligase
MGTRAASLASLSNRKTIAIVLLPLIVALVPLVIAPGLLFYYDVTPKIVILALGVAAALPWFSPARLLARREGRWLAILLAAQAVSLVLSTAFSSRVGLSVSGANWRRFGLIAQVSVFLFTALAAADLCAAPLRMRSYLRASAAAALPISLYGIAQYFGWDPWIPKQAYHIGEGTWSIVRPPGTLGYVTYFASYLVCAVFLGIASFRTEAAGFWKVAGAAASVLGSCAIVLSGTRAALLALLVGAVWMWLWNGRRLGMRAVAIAVGGLIAIALFYFSPAGGMLRSRVHWAREDVWGGARFLLWRDSLALATRHPLLGAGPETFSSEFPKVQSAALARAYPDFYYESAHNIFLDALTAQGAIGLLALAAFIGLGFYAAWAGRKSEPDLAGVLGAGLMAALVVNQFAVFTAPTALCFYLVVAMLVSLGGRSVETSLDAARTSARATVGGLVLTAFALGVFAARLLLADAWMARTRADFEAGRPRDAALSYQRARNFGIAADIWYSRQVMAMATDLAGWQQALESGVRATKTADDPHNAWYQLASLYARQNKSADTERCLRQAISAAPNWFKPHWILAEVLLAANKRDEARAEAALARDLDGGKNAEVAQTLLQIQAQDR